MKAILAAFMFFFMLPLAFAAGGIDITSIETSLSGNSGTLSGSFNLTNTANSPLTVAFSNYVLTSGSNTITINSISSRTIANGTTQTVSFSVPIGTSSPGTYAGALNVTNSTNGYVFGQVPITVNVGMNENYTLPSTVTITVDPESSSTGTLSIVNTGNVNLSGLSISYDSSNFIDNYGNSISINFSQISGIDVPKGQTKSIVITASAPEKIKEGTYSGTVTVNGLITKTFTLTINVRSVLRITDLEIKTSTKNSDKVTRGSNLTVKVDYENFAKNIDITDIDLKIKILDGTKILEDDSGEDIEEKVSVKDLDAGDDGSYTFKLKMPMNIDNEKTYTIVAEIFGKNDDDSSQRFYNNMTAEVKSVINKHDIEIYKANFDTPTLSCNDKNVVLTVGVRNIGRSDEDVELIVNNLNLKMEQIAMEKLTTDFDEESYYVEKNFIFNFNERPAAGTYTFNIYAYYNDGDDKKTKTATLTVESCSTVTTTTTQTTTTQTPPQQQETQVVYVPTTPTTISTAPMSLTDTSRWDLIDWELVALVALFAVLGGATIGLIIKLFGSIGQIKEYK